jgi:hypothetical protein
MSAHVHTDTGISSVQQLRACIAHHMYVVLLTRMHLGDYAVFNVDACAFQSGQNCTPVCMHVCMYACMHVCMHV